MNYTVQRYFATCKFIYMSKLSSQKDLKRCGNAPESDFDSCFSNWALAKLCFYCYKNITLVCGFPLLERGQKHERIAVIWSINKVQWRVMDSRFIDRE